MSLQTEAPTRLAGRERFAKPQTVVGHVVGFALMVAGIGMAASAVVEKLDGGRGAVGLLASGLAVFVPGLILWARTSVPERVPVSSIFAGALAAWGAFSVAAAIPYLAAGTLRRFDLALFEGVAGTTTTAATVLVAIDRVSKGVLLWRALTQWIGGIGIVVFVVSAFPYLRSAGLESAGGFASGSAGERLAPRVRETAKRLVLLYVAFTIVVAALYAAFGMTTFDAVAHAFTTVSTGGFSTHGPAFWFFRSASLQWVAIGAMVVAGGSFPLYWRAIRGKPLSFTRAVEFRVYLFLVVAIGGIAVVSNASSAGYSGDLVRRTLFTTVSISTTTGYTLLDFNRWVGSVQLLLLFAMAIGGMAGSPAGGFKVYRLIGVASHVRRHVFRQLHPRAVPIVRVGSEVIPDAVVMRVLGYFGLFMATGAVATFVVAALGNLDLRSAMSGVASALGNVGPGLGVFGPLHRFRDLDASVRDVLMVVMLAGRLEIYPLILGVVPALRFVGDRLPPRLAQGLIRLFRG